MSAGPASPGRGHLRRGHLRLAAALLWLAAIIPGIRATHDLRWPYDADHFRDLATIQTLRDGGGFVDPHYAGEAAWYNPLLPGLVALVSHVTQAPAPVTFTRLGAWLNALPPLLFLFCAWRLIGPLAALPAFCAWLFLPHSPPAWGAATYSPWIFPAATAHALFYGGLVAWTATLERPSYSRLLIVGALLGLTLLAHTAPAIVFALLIVISAPAIAHPAIASPAIARTARVASSATADTTAAERSQKSSSRMLMAISAIAIIAIVAATIAAPFLLPLIARYGLHVVNRAPATWIDDRLTFDALPRLFIGSAIPTIVLVAIGTVHLMRHGRRATLIVLSAWVVAATALLLYAIAAQSSTTLPTLVPAYHFYYLLRAVVCLGFGAGFVAIADAIAGWWTRRQPASGAAAPGVADAPDGRASSAGAGGATSGGVRGGAVRRALITAWLVPVLTLVLTATLYRGYLRREAFTAARRAALQVAEAQDDRAVTEWIRQHTPRDAVFLASDRDGLRIVGPAGRKMISVESSFSNPYVDRSPRAAVRDRLLEAFAAGDHDRFLALAQPFQVTHIVERLPEPAGGASVMAATAATATIAAAAPPTAPGPTRQPWLEPIFRAGPLAVHRIRRATRDRDGRVTPDD